MANKKLMKRLGKVLVEEGWTKRMTGDTHLHFTPPFPGRPIVLSRTPSSGRAYWNSLAEVRRVYRSAGKESPV